MNIKLKHIMFLTIGMIVTHAAAIWGGFYQGKVWVDMPLHFIGGVLLGFFGLYLGEKLKEKEVLIVRPEGALWISAPIGALFGSFLWEIFEFSFLAVAPEYAHLFKIYSLTASDLLSDMSLGLAGGGMVAVVHVLYKKDV